MSTIPTLARVCSRCKASVDALPGEPCPACREPFVEISIEERAQLLVAKMRAEMAAKAAAKAAAAQAEVPPVVEAEAPPVAEPEDPVVELAPPEVDEAVVDDHPIAEATAGPIVEPAEPPDAVAADAEPPPPVPPQAEAAPVPTVEEPPRAATASPALPKEFRSERIKLKPVVPKPEPPPPPPDPNLPRERVPLPAFVPLVAGKPAPPPPTPEPKVRVTTARSSAARAALLFLLLGAIGFGAWERNLLPIPAGETPRPTATPAQTTTVASPVPSGTTIVATLSTAQAVALASPSGAAAILSPVIAPVSPVFSPVVAPVVAPVTPVPHAAPVTDPKADALVRARAHFDRAEYDEAANALRAILLDHDDFAEAHAMLGTTLASEGDKAGACEEYARYLELATSGALVEQVRRASAPCPH